MPTRVPGRWPALISFPKGTIMWRRLFAVQLPFGITIAVGTEWRG